ncbi:MAG: cytochrome c3 family protein [Desulfatibacillum sp.]|nr:cytochrome c3 family protein [Desulfatibacillum sp.]
MKKRYFLMFALIVFMVSGLMVHAGMRVEKDNGEICAPIQTMILYPPEDVEARQPDVRFPHATHFDYSCKTCHHMWEGDSGMDACMDCHDTTEYVSRKAPKEEYIMYYQAAYHGLCRDCHADIGRKNKEIKKENLGKSEEEQAALLPNGPKSCRTCHVVEPAKPAPEKPAEQPAQEKPAE